MRLVAVFIILISCAEIADAQSYDFVKGYLVKGPDTLRGFVGSTTDPWNQKEFRFKAAAKSKDVKVYRDGEISAFYFEPSDERFFKRSLLVDKKSIVIAKLTSTPDPDPVMDTVYLQTLVTGSINLYFYFDEKAHFFVEKNGTVEELSYIKYVVDQKDASGTRTVTTINGFRGRLRTLIGDCSPQNVDKLAYSKTAIKTVISQYNTCKSDLKYVQKKEKLFFNASILGGLSPGRLDYSGSANGDLPLDTYNASVAVFPSASGTMFGGTFELSTKKMARIRFSGEVIFRSATTHTATNNVTYAFDTRKDYAITSQYSAINLGLKLRVLRKGDLSLWFQGNYSLGFGAKIQSSQRQTFNSSTTDYSPLATFNSSGFGLVGAVQLNYKRYFIQFRSESMEIKGDVPVPYSAGSGVVAISTGAMCVGISLK